MNENIILDDISEREEGEIIELSDNDLEDISSDEVFEIKERIAELEARNLEIEKIKIISAKPYKTNPSSTKHRGTGSTRSSLPSRKRHKSGSHNINPVRWRSQLQHPVVRLRKNESQVKSVTRSLGKSSRRRRRRRSSSRTIDLRTPSSVVRRKSSRKLKTIHLSSSSSDDEPVLDKRTKRQQLEAALCGGNRRKRTTGLDEKLKIKGWDDEITKISSSDDENVLKLRLEALKSKTELKIESRETSPAKDRRERSESPSKRNYEEFSLEEQELRLIALKSAYVKKFEARKRRKLLQTNESDSRPYTPSAAVEVLEINDVNVTNGNTVTPNGNGTDYSDNNMDISPIASPTPVDEYRPIDMDLAVSETSNSPANFAEKLLMNNSPVTDWNHGYGSPMFIPIDSYHSSESNQNSREIPSIRDPSIKKLIEAKRRIENLKRQRRDEENLKIIANSVLSGKISPASTGSVWVRTPPKNTPISNEKTLEIERRLRELEEGGLQHPDEKNPPLTEIGNISTETRREDSPTVLGIVSSTHKSEENIADISLEADCLRSLLLSNLNKKSKKNSIVTETIQLPPSTLLPPSSIPPQSQNDSVMHTSDAMSTINKTELNNELPSSDKITSLSMPPFTLRDNNQIPINCDSSKLKVVSKTIKPKPKLKAAAPVKPKLSVPLKKVTPATTTKVISPIVSAQKPKEIKKPSPITTSNSPTTELIQFKQQIVPKLVIQLGNSDSSTTDDECDRVPGVSGGGPSSSTNNNRISNGKLSSNVIRPQPQKLTPPLTNDFETKLEHFLKNVRSRCDSVHKRIDAVTTRTSTAGGNGVIRRATFKPMTITERKPIVTTVTPTAVRHLPPSSQIEYKSLVHRMKLLEQQKLERLATKINRTAQNISVTVHNDITKATTLGSDSRTLFNDVIQKPGITEVGTAGELNLLDTKVKNIVVHLDVVNASGTPAIITNSAASTSTTTNTTTTINTISPIDGITKSFKRTIAGDIQKLNNIDPPNSTPLKTIINKQPVVAVRKTPLKSKMVTRKKSITQLTPAQTKLIEEEETEKRGYENMLKSVDGLNEDERKLILDKIEREYHDHGTTFLNELNSLVDLIQVAQQEKEKQIGLELELKELRERMAIVERSLDGQKQTLSDLYPKISTSHQKILKSRKKCTTIDQFCQKLGKIIQGDEYKLPVNKNSQIMERLKDISKESRKLKELNVTSKKEKIVDKENVESSLNNSSSSNSEETPKSDVKERDVCVSVIPASEPLSCSSIHKYNSPLDHMNVNDDAVSKRNPNGVICPFELSGKCEDSACQYEHFTIKSNT